MEDFLFGDLGSFDSVRAFLPEEIEAESMRIIRGELSRMGISVPAEIEKVVLRCIHATADFDFASSLVFSKDAVSKAVSLLKNGKPVVVTDTNMALSGISSRFCASFGIEKACFMADDDVACASKKSGLTRAACSVDKAVRLFGGRPVFFAVGNAPTALVRLRQLHDAGIFTPAFVVACPVGFVNVVQAKELVLSAPFDSIVARGRKGGSSVAAAIVNALLYS